MFKKLTVMLLSVLIVVAVPINLYALRFAAAFNSYHGEVVHVNGERIYVEACPLHWNVGTIVFTTDGSTYFVEQRPRVGDLIVGYFQNSGQTTFTPIEALILDMTPHSQGVNGEYVIDTQFRTTIFGDMNDFESHEIEEWFGYRPLQYGTFYVDFNSDFAERFEVGDTIRGYIGWPWLGGSLFELPTYPAALIINGNYNVVVGNFDDNHIISHIGDRGIALNIDSNTIIVTSHGTRFRGELNGTVIAAVLNEPLDGMLRVATPNKIIVLLSAQESVDFEGIQVTYSFTIPQEVMNNPVLLSLHSRMRHAGATSQELNQMLQEFESNHVNVTIHNQLVFFDGEGPVNVGGRTLVPVRRVFETLGFYVEWDYTTQRVMLTRAHDEIIVTIGSSIFTVNDDNFELDVPAMLIENRTMLPIRALLESLGYFVDWCEDARVVLVSYRNAL